MIATRNDGFTRWGAALLALPMLLGGCTRTIAESTLLRGHSAPRAELRDDILRHNVELGSASGEPLLGWYLENPRATRLVLFFGGNGLTLLENAESLWRLADALQAEVVAFDYRGYGFSAGQPSLRAMQEDAPRIAAFARTLSERRGLRLAIVGQSLGTFPAAHAATPAWVEELILIAPAASLNDLVQAVGHTLPWYRHAVMGASLERVGIDPSADLAATRAALLLIHSANDSLLPLAGTERLLQASPAPRKTICRARGDYGEMAATNPDVRRCMLSFLAKTIPVEPGKQSLHTQASASDLPQATARR